MNRAHGYVAIYTVWSINLGRVVYVGQSISPDTRWARHCSEARRSPVAGSLAHAIFRHGSAAFVFTVVATAPSRRVANRTEQDLIVKYRTLAPHGFNRTSGGGWDFTLTKAF